MAGKFRVSLIWGLLCLALAAVALAADAPGETGSVVRVVKVAATINPAVAEYVTEQLAVANRNDELAVIVQLDTPGGLDTAMREIVQAILNSAAPVIVYVAPSGARAASAGAIISLAADIAAMAPGTNIGAAHPVSIGWQGGEGQESEGVGMTKALNDAVAYARSLAEQRGRNADWAERAVRESVSTSANEALELGVIDLLASDLATLLAELDGMSYRRGDETLQLATAGAVPVYSEMSWRQQLLNTLANPNVAYLLLMLGILGIFFEISQPGVILPGVLGAIALLLAFYALQTLPVNYAGVLLILLGVILFILEVKVVSYGMLSVGALVALALGSTMLIRSADPAMAVSPWVIGLTLTGFGGLVAAVVYLVARTQRAPTVTGVEALAGSTGEVVAVDGAQCRVFLHGEYWTADCRGAPEPGDRVRVVAVRDGMRLDVEPVTDHERPESTARQGDER